MAIDKSWLTGSTGMLVLKLLEEDDMYGYQMIEELARRSDNTFTLKAGTLYPLLHSLERAGWLTSYDQAADGKRVRKYYRLTNTGRRTLADKEAEWQVFSAAVGKVLNGGVGIASI